MKRSEMVSIISAELAPLVPGYDERLADRLLTIIESTGMAIVADNEVQPYEPEEGWDAWLEAQDKADQARDFVVPENEVSRGAIIARQFLSGKSFEELSAEHYVTRERVRQIVCKYRRLYK